MSDLDDLRARQNGVVTRGQLLEHGVDETMIRRMLRRRDLVVALPGVYVDHTGEPIWVQRAWVAVLALAPSALCHDSALRADDGPGRRGAHDVLHVAVDRTRSPDPPPGVRLHRLAHLDDKAQWHLAPPRVRIEHAVLDVAAEARDELAAIAVLADAVQSRRTTPSRLAETLAGRRRIARRDFLAAVLRDVAEGTCSVLEHGYLARVERPHGLPTARRQVEERQPRTIFRDVDYPDHGVIVELDGRLFHDSARARDADLDRDLAAATSGRVTLRLGWGQVLDRGCETAVRVGAVLQRHGWSGAPVPCPRCAGATVRYSAATG